MRKPDAAFGEVLRSHEPKIRAMLAPRCSDAGIDVDDVLQEMRIRLWKSLESGKKIEKPASYLYRVACTSLIDAVRKARIRPSAAPKRDVAEVPRPDETTPEHEMAAHQLSRNIERIVDALAVNRRRALGLFLQGMTIEDIARLCGWGEAKTRNLAYRALADLKQALASEADHER